MYQVPREAQALLVRLALLDLLQILAQRDTLARQDGLVPLVFLALQQTLVPLALLVSLATLA